MHFGSYRHQCCTLLWQKLNICFRGEGILKNVGTGHRLLRRWHPLDFHEREKLLLDSDQRVRDFQNVSLPLARFMDPLVSIPQKHRVTSTFPGDVEVLWMADKKTSHLKADAGVI